MKMPPNVEKKIRRFAAKEAAAVPASTSKKLDKAAESMEAVAEMVCPECGHKGPMDEFEPEGADVEEGDEE